MPTTYAHYRLGAKVLEKLPDTTQKTIIAHRELYDIGVHGPDIFFYHNPLFQNSIVKLGINMHHESGGKFFRRAAAVVHKNENKEAHKAYLYGFLCHFAMDVTCHGYIDERIKETGIGHYEIEAEYDRALLEKDGKEATRACLTTHLHAKKKYASVISDFWKEVTAKQAEQTIKRMVFFLNTLRAPSRLKRSLLFGIMKLFGIYESLHGLVINEKENPAGKETTDWLLAHFEEAVTLAVRLITEYEQYLLTGGSLSDTFSYNYESQKKE